MKIRKLQLKNIGVFDDETIEFQPCPAKDKAEIHIFTGQNGSGKTTILQALVSRFDFYIKSNLAVIENCHPLPNNFHKRFRKDGSILVISDFSSNGNIFVKTRLDWGEKLPYPLGWQEEQMPSDYWVSSLSEGKPYDNEMSFRFIPFALSGYRRIESERVEAIKEPKDFNPLSQALEFVKDYNQTNQLTINQLIANNISKSAIEKGRNEQKSRKFANVLNSISMAISQITGWKIEFDLETEPINLITRVNGIDLEFDVLPDGLRSLISWIADLLGRVDLLKWQDDLPIMEKNLILFLDEIEVHLHPAWQRKVLPVVQKLFKNAQIFVSTHSPFVVNSVDDAWVYKLELENGKAKVSEPVRSEDGISYQTVLREIFGIEQEFGGKTQEDLDKFYKIVRNGNEFNENELKKLAKSLAEQSEELNAIVQIELRQLSRRKGKEILL
ncbi:MAG TPA: AAA family ATPase [Pyrinomonadaceae bacterium]|nr:AAA family ATPase [Pyrinomonadaceae bacterium]